MGAMMMVNNVYMLDDRSIRKMYTAVCELNHNIIVNRSY